MRSSSSTPTPASNASRARLSVQAINIVLVIGFFSALTYGYLAYALGSWQMYVFTGVVLVAMVSFFVSLRLIHSGRQAWGAHLALYTIVFGFTCGGFLVADLGLVLAIGAFLTTVGLASVMVERPTPHLLASLTAGLLIFFFDLYAPDPDFRLSVPQIELLVPVLVAGLIIGVGVLALRQFPNYSLRTKFIVVFVSITVLAIGLVAFIIDQTARTQLTEEIGQKLYRSAQIGGKLVGDILTQEINALKAFSLSKTLQDAVEQASATNSGDLVALQQLDEQWRAADAAGNDADPLVTRVLEGAVAEELLEFREQFPENVEVFVTDKFGANVAATNRTSDYYQADEEWWQQAYNAGQGGVFIGQPEYDESVGSFAIIIAVPLIAHSRSEVVGVLRTTIGLQKMVTLLSTLRPDEDGDADLFLPSQQAIDPAQTDELEDISAEDLQRLSTITTYGAIDYEGAPRIFTQAPVTASNLKDAEIVRQTGWSLLLYEDRDTALAPVIAIQRAIAVTAVGVLLFVVLLAVWVTQVIAGPIIRLTGVASQVADGDLQVQAVVESQDEVGTLAQTFNSMTQQLRETLEGLEQRVANRTRQLATVAEVSTATSRILDPQQLLQQVVDLTKKQFGLYHAHIYLLNPAGDTLQLTAGAGDVGRAMVSEHRTIPLNREQSLVARAARGRAGVIVNDVRAAPDFLPHSLLPHTRSELAVPIIVGDKVLGVFDVQGDTVDRFTETDAQVQTTLAGQIGVALQNARQYADAAQQRATLQAILDNLPLGVFVVDTLHKTPLLTNKAQEDLLGQPADDATSVGQFSKVAGLYHAGSTTERADPNELPLRRAIHTGQPQRGEFNLALTDGSFITMEGTVSPITDATGQANSVVAVFRDVTERRQQQAALQASEARLAKLTENAPGMIYQFVLRPDGSAFFPYTSPGSRTLFGLEPEQLRLSANPIISLIHPDDLAGFQASVAHSAQTLELWQWEGRFVLPDGKVIYGEGKSKPERLPDGSVLWNGVLNDISERKQNEATTQRVAERERLINEISQKIQSAVTMEGALQTAARELGQVFKAQRATAQVGVNTPPDNGH